MLVVLVPLKVIADCQCDDAGCPLDSDGINDMGIINCHLAPCAKPPTSN
jgi:hypothetical protein